MARTAPIAAHSFSRPFAVSIFICLIGCLPGMAQNGPAPQPKKEAPIELPKMTVEGEKIEIFPRFPKVDIDPPGISVHEPPLELFFPGQAYANGISTGRAIVGVMLDESGNPIDYLLIAYTQEYFGLPLSSSITPTIARPVDIPFNRKSTR